VIVDEASGFIQNYKPNHVVSAVGDCEYIFADEVTADQPKLLIFSANDEGSLKTYFNSIIKYLVNPNTDVQLNDLAYTLSDRRARHYYKGYVVTDDLSFSSKSLIVGHTSDRPAKVGFVFTGQGAQWPQMGKQLLESFPIAKLTVKHLDTVLQGLEEPPKWNLYGKLMRHILVCFLLILIDELVEQRSPEHLRRPEFAQPLTTALQLAILALLKTWGIEYHCVTGHSSGEIAAAVAAELITSDEAIIVAYMRGKAASDLKSQVKGFGMLAVGVGQSKILKYLPTTSQVCVACINSPNSVTISGSLESLEELKNTLQADGHFARLLQVDIPYHSHFIDNIASHYQVLLEKCFDSRKPKLATCSIKMISTVDGQHLCRDLNSTYWKQNMISPVLFQNAVERMVTDGINILVEIGPSGALSGPIAQIKKTMGAEGESVKYCKTLDRRGNSVNTLLGIAGQIFISGGQVNISHVNKEEGHKKLPSAVVDLPNYSWNHSIKYWHESESSKDWRFRQFPTHDLLGTKILGTSW
jgi:acyl transferase domain-containing protein